MFFQPKNFTDSDFFTSLDRTSMSITWEMARVLSENHSLPKEKIHEIAHIFRADVSNLWTGDDYVRFFTLFFFFFFFKGCEA